MARKEKIVNIDADNRDKGKRFKIIEMDCIQAENWATKAIHTLVESNPDLLGDLDINDLQGLGGLQTLLEGKNDLQELNEEEAKTFIKITSFASKLINLLGKADYNKLKALYDELLSCCSFMDKVTQTSIQLTTTTAPTIIEEVATLLLLRKEALGLHFDFLSIGGKQKSDTPPTSEINLVNLSATPTSQI